MSAVLCGLVLNVAGSIVIAAPDFPKVNEYMTPKELRTVISQLEDGETVVKGDVGFENLISIMEKSLHDCHRTQNVLLFLLD